MSRAPLSSIGLVPLTEDTRQRLLDAGVSEESLGELTELGGQSLLLLHDRAKDEGEGRPSCFARKFDPGAFLCAGCVFMPQCWPRDHSYMNLLKGGEADPPPGVPRRVLEQYVGDHKVRVPAPPPSGKRAPPPPPARKRRAPPPPPPRRKR